jgi:hypothetical protein
MESAIDLVLLGRDHAKTELVAQDLQVRSPQSTITVQTTDFLDPLRIREWSDRLVAKGLPDIVLIAHGSLPDQIACQKDLGLCHEAIAVNGVSPVLFAEAFAGHMQQAGSGTLAIIGSVAGDRGRKSNYVYGAAKGLIARYAQGLQHRFAGTGVHVVLIEPGPTDTPMTSNLKTKGARLADVGEVARIIVAGIRRRKACIYAPAKWALIMMIIRHLPRFVFNRLDI